MVIASVAGVCVLLAVLAFLAPRLSRHPERGAHRALGKGGRLGRLAPGRLGRWFARPFGRGSRAAGRSASAGRRARGRLPL